MDTIAEDRDLKIRLKMSEQKGFDAGY